MFVFQEKGVEIDLVSLYPKKFEHLEKATHEVRMYSSGFVF